MGHPLPANVIEPGEQPVEHIAIERTADPTVVRQVVEHPGVRPHIHEGETAVPIPVHESIYYLAAKVQRYSEGAVEDVLIGVMAFLPVNGAAWNPHIAILPAHRGTGTEAMRLGVAWMFENTPCEKIVAHPPVFNTAMVRVFEKCGFRREGYSPRSFRWHGELHDRFLMGIEKEPS